MVHDVGPCPTDIIAAWQNLEEVYLKAADASSLRIRVLAMVPIYSWYTTTDPSQLSLAYCAYMVLKCHGHQF